jgi:hypothetical protein
MMTLYMQSLIQSDLNGIAQNALPGLQSGLQGVAKNALQNGIQSVSTVVPNDATSAGIPAAGGVTSQGSSQGSSLPPPVASLSPPPALTSATETKSGIVQLLTELVQDKEFKQLVMEKISDPVFASLQEKLQKNVEMTDKIRSLQAAFETAFDAAKPDEIQTIVKKFNADMKAAFENVPATPNQTGGGRRNRRPTRRRFSSRAFQRTLGRTRNYQ